MLIPVWCSIIWSVSVKRRLVSRCNSFPMVVLPHPISPIRMMFGKDVGAAPFMA